MKKIKCYILSIEHGTCQIGHTVFQPCNNETIHAGSMKDCTKENMIEVEGGKDKETAMKALRIYRSGRTQEENSLWLTEPPSEKVKVYIGE